MPYYFTAQIKIHDEEEYEKYILGSDQIFKKYKGQYLAVDDQPEIIEGNWNYSRTVLIRFNCKKDFEAWYYSEDYQKILLHRMKAAKCDSILVHAK